MMTEALGAGRWRFAVQSPFTLFVELPFFATLPIERILTVDVAGFTIRPAYLFMAAFLILRRSRIGAGLRAMPVAVLVAAATILSLIATYDRRQSAGYALWALFTILFALAAVGTLSTDRGALDRWTRLAIWTGAAWSIVTVGQWLGALAVPSLAYSSVGSVPRVQALAFEPSFLAFYFAPLLMLAAGTSSRVAAPLILVGLLLTTSRTGLVGLAVGALVLLVVAPRPTRRRALQLAPLVIVPLAAILLISRFAYLDFVTKVVTLRDPTSITPRLQSWTDAWKLFLARPVTGVGTGAYGAAAHAHGIDLGGATSQIKTTNLVLETMAELGIVGLVSFVLWAFGPVPELWRARAWDARARALLAAIAAAIAMFPLVQTWWVPYHWLPWILAFGLRAELRTGKPLRAAVAPSLGRPRSAEGQRSGERCQDAVGDAGARLADRRPCRPCNSIVERGPQLIEAAGIEQDGRLGRQFRHCACPACSDREA